MDVQFIKQKITPVLSAYPDVELAYLFGSQVNEHIGPMSDVDIAVLFQRPVDIAVMMALKHQIGEILQCSHVDLISLNSASIELSYSVICNGKNIYMTDLATLVEYEAKVLSLYGDYLPVLKSQKQDLLNRSNHEKRIQRYREAFGRTERTLDTIGTAQTKITR